MYYKLGEHEFQLICSVDELVGMCLDHYIDRVVDVYLDVSIDTEIGSSSIRVKQVVGSLDDSKGKEVKEEGGENDTDLEEFEDFSDSDYEMNETEEENDDEMFNKNLNEDAEWAGINDREGRGPNENDGDDLEGGVGENQGSSDDDFDSGGESDNEQDSKCPVFSGIDTYDPKFELGMIVSNRTEFRLAIHAIKTKRNIKIAKNDGRRIYAKCAAEGFEWRIHALKLSNQRTFQIREYYSNHKCGVSFNVKNLKCTWLSGKYESSFRSDPKRNVKGFRNDVINDMMARDTLWILGNIHAQAENGICVESLASMQYLPFVVK